MPKLSEGTNLGRRYGVHGYVKPRKASKPRPYSATKPRGRRKRKYQRTQGPPLPPSRTIGPNRQQAASDRP